MSTPSRPRRSLTCVRSLCRVVTGLQLAEAARAAEPDPARMVQVAGHLVESGQFMGSMLVAQGDQVCLSRCSVTKQVMAAAVILQGGQEIPLRRKQRVAQRWRKDRLPGKPPGTILHLARSRMHRRHGDCQVMADEPGRALVEGDGPPAVTGGAPLA